MLKRKAFAFVLSALLGLAVFLPSGAAADLVQEISAQINQNVTILWDGTAFVPTDASGNKVDPIIYENRVYVPLRSFGEESGCAVTWDPATKTITVTSPEAPAESQDTSSSSEDSDVEGPATTSVIPVSLINDLPPYDSADFLELGSVTIDEVQYKDCFYTYTRMPTSASWHLDKKYSKLNFSFGNMSTTDCSDGIRITDGDKNLTLYWSPKLDPGYVMSNEIDVSSIDTLQIYLNGYTAIWDVRVTPTTE